ncbi:MAG: hypothetical protein AABW63_02540 [Nanoarchaeota archaeon]
MINFHNPRPHEIIQKPDLCCAANVAIEDQRRGIDYGGSLENLAVRMGLYINANYKDMYGPELQKRALPSGDAQIGMTFESFENSERLKNIVKGSGLEAEAYRLSRIVGSLDGVVQPTFEMIQSVGSFLTNNLKAGNGITINYRLEPFTGREDGHYVSLFAYDDTTNEVYVCDPSPHSPEYWKEGLNKFITGMLPIWKEDDGKKRERGLIVLSGPMLKNKENPNKIRRLLKNIKTYVPINARVRIYPAHPEERSRPYQPIESRE